jgi:hypothetical protein
LKYFYEVHLKYITFSINSRLPLLFSLIDKTIKITCSIVKNITKLVDDKNKLISSLECLIKILCDVLKSIGKFCVIIKIEEIPKIINNIYEIFSFCYEQHQIFLLKNVDDVIIEMFKIIDDINYFKKKNNPGYILDILCKLSYLGVDVEKEKIKEINIFNDKDEYTINKRNKILQDLFNYMDVLMKEEVEEMMKMKLYCSISFGFINKGRIINTDFSIIKKFLSEIISSKYESINTQDMKLAKESYSCIKA